MECNKNINELTVNTIIYYIYLQYRENMILFNIYIYIYVKTRVSIERIVEPGELRVGGDMST